MSVFNRVGIEMEDCNVCLVSSLYLTFSLLPFFQKYMHTNSQDGRLKKMIHLILTDYDYIFTKPIDFLN